MRAIAAAVLILLSAGASYAQVIRSSPQPAALPPPIAAPRDVAYSGLLKLDIDATDLDRRIFRVRETIPVSKAGPMTLLYAEWVPGGHSPRNPIHNFIGLKITAGGKPVPWTRDPVGVRLPYRRARWCFCARD